MNNKIFSIFFSICYSLLISNTFAQQSISLGKGSYAEFPPEACAYEDGYFAAPYKWFELAWNDLNLHENVKNRPIPTNKWWTDFIFRGLGKVQPEYHKPPVTVTTIGNRFGTEAWAYPHMVKASANGYEVFIPKGFSGGGMIKGNPLKIHATSALQANDENVVFADFESATWTAGWTVSNNTKNIPGPMATSEITQSPRPNGYQGDRFINTFKGDDARLTLVSPNFTIQKKYIRLFVGGGNHPNETFVGLFVNGNKIYEEVGQNSGNLTQRTWNVSDYIGQSAQIKIVDNSGGGWGFIMCDHIVFTDSEFGGSGYTADFATTAAKVYDWSDLSFTLRSDNNNNKAITSTIIHGVPFTYFEFQNLYPLLVPESGNAKIYNASGLQLIDFPAQINVFSIEADNRVFGIHAPSGTTIHRSNGGDFQLEISGNNRYVVISALPDKSFLSVYDQYARNKPGNCRYAYEYKASEGKITTSFTLDTKNLDSGATGGSCLMSFLPHHYRTTSKNFDFITGADYDMFIGKLHTAAGASFEISYPFGGLPPYLPEPLNLSQDRKDMLTSMLEYASQRYYVNGNTYAKGLGENSALMLMARMMDIPGYKTLQNRLKDEFTDWFTFDASEINKKERYFAKYPNYGAIIGFSPGYGSQGFNDLHFHNGYFTVGAARLMMLDQDFKRDFSEMVQLITKTYANWDRYENNVGTYIPFLRTFDPYLGHSFAGGTGDGGGNNQESISEAINSWFGIYLLGLELNDTKIMETGIMGHTLENISAGEYWLDIYSDNFPATYNHDYVGIKRTDNLAWATYFAGDPAWVLGIQACPSDFFFTDFAKKPERTQQIQQSMFTDRTTFIYDGKPMYTNNDPYDNIKTMGPYLGGYHLNIMNYYNPVNASQWLDEYCRQDGQAGQEWRNHTNAITNYYLSNAMVTYGNPAEGYHTSISSGAVYKNHLGEITYLLYNPSSHDVQVKIYKDGQVVETITVSAGKFYNSRIPEGYNPTVNISTYKNGDKLALNKKVKIGSTASDKDGQVVQVNYYIDDVLIGTSDNEPFDIIYQPTVPGLKNLKAVAIDNEGEMSEPHIVNIEVLSTEQTSFNGQPWRVPQDKILAVQFDNGGPEISCHDNEIEMKGGNNFRPGTGVETENSNNGDGNIGYTETGEWYEYTLNVQSTGIYSLSAKLSSAGGGAIRFEFDGVDSIGSIPVKSTGSWGNYKDTILTNLVLFEGKQIMRVIIDKRGMNLSSLKFNFVSDYTSIKNSKLNNDIRIESNAYQSFLKIKIEPESKYHTVRLTSLDGKLILNKDIKDMSIIEIQTGNIDKGYYLLTVYSDSSAKTFKIIKL